MTSKSVAKAAAPVTTAATKMITQTLKLWEIMEIYQAIVAAGAIKLPMQIVAFRIALNKNLLKPFIEAYDDQVRALQEKHVKKDPKTGRMIKKKVTTDEGIEVELNEWESDDIDAWNKALAELNNVPHEISFHAIKLADFGKAEIEQRLMGALVYMIEE